MSYSMNVSGDTMEELVDNMTAALSAFGASPAEPVEDKPKAKPRAKPKPKDKPKEEEASNELDDDGGEEVTDTKEDVQKALKEFAALEGRDEAIKIIEDTGKASSVSEIAPELYAAVIAACEA